MIIKRKLYSVGAVITGGFNVLGVAGMAGDHKSAKQAKAQHAADMAEAEQNNKQLVSQLNNIAKS